MSRWLTDEEATINESLNRASLLGARFHTSDECRAPGDTDQRRFARGVARLLAPEEGVMVRGKFQVIEVAQLHWSKDARRVKLQAVMDNSTEENRRYAKATPSGSIEMTIDNPPASDFLAVGKTFYVDFLEAQP